MDLNHNIPCMGSVWTLHAGCEFHELATGKKHLATHNVNQQDFYRSNDNGTTYDGDPFIIIVEGYLTEQNIVVDDLAKTNQLIVAVLWEGYNFETDRYTVYRTDINNLQKLHSIDKTNHLSRTLIPQLVDVLSCCK